MHNNQIINLSATVLPKGLKEFEMRQRFHTRLIFILTAACFLFFAWHSSAGRRKSEALNFRQSDPHVINVAQWGPSQQAIEAAKARVMNHPLLRTSPKSPLHKPASRQLSCNRVRLHA
jgi:hypothetical protein